MRLYQNSAQFYWINHQINPLHTMPGASIPAEAFVSFSSYKQSINTSGLPSDHHYQTLQRPKRFLPNSRKVLPFFPVSLDSTKSHYKNGMILPSYCTLRKGHKSLPIDSRSFIRNDKKVIAADESNNTNNQRNIPSSTLPWSKKNAFTSFIQRDDAISRDTSLLRNKINRLPEP